MSFYHQLRLMTAGESLAEPNAVSLLNKKYGSRRGARYWLKALSPAYDSMTSGKRINNPPAPATPGSASTPPPPSSPQPPSG
jgi:hypothetical protein